MPRKNAFAKVVNPPPAPLKLDFGCGPNKREGFQGVDAIAFPGVDFVVNVAWHDPHVPGLIDPTTDKDAVILPSGFVQWPWADKSVGEAHASHFLEHLTGLERVHFFNELYRVLIPGGTCQIITPHWASCRSYGDFTHQWPPVSEFLWYYLDRNWRRTNAAHTDSEHNPVGYTCDFDSTWFYTLHPEIAKRNPEYHMYALANFKEAAQDMICTVKARK